LLPQAFLDAWQLDDGMGALPFAEYGPDSHPGATFSNEVAEDSRGNIYVGNEAGALQFDGEGWSMLPATGHEPMVVAIDIDTKDRIWIGGTDHVGYYEADSQGDLYFNDLTPDFKSILAGDKHGIIWNIFSDGRLHYVVTNFQVMIWDGASWQRHDFEVERRILPTWLDGRLFIYVRGDGLYRFRENEPGKILDEHESLSCGIINVLSAKPKELRLATITNGIWTVRDGVLEKESENPLPQGHALDHIVLNEDQTLIAYAEGVFVQRTGGESIQINKDEIASGYRLFKSSDGSIWITSIDAIYRIPAGRHTRYHQETDHLERHDGHIYISSGSSLFKLGDGVEASLAQGWLSAPLSRGPFLIYTNGDSLHAVLDGKKHHSIPLERICMFIEESISDEAVFYTNDNPEVSRWRVNEQGLRRLSQTEGTKNLFISLAEVDARTSLYTTNSFEVGLIHWPADEGDGVLPSVENLTVNPGEAGSFQYAKAMQLGAKAILATDRGFFAFDPEAKKFHRIEALKGDLGQTWSDIVTCSIADRAGAVVYIKQSSTLAGHRLGLLRYDDQNGFRWEPLKLKGLADLGAVRTLLHEEREGRAFLWVGGSKDLFRYEITEPEIHPPLPVNLRAIKETIAGRIYYGGFGSLPTEASWPFPQKSLKISYAAPASELRAKGYQTHLVGFRDEWSALTESTSREFSNLYEGDYTFEVRAIDELGRPGPSTTFAFTILPPWYRSLYAYLGYIALVVGFLLLTARLWTQHLRRRNLELETLVAQRTDELELSNRQLREANSVKQNFLASMSHEIRNPLNGILGIAQLLRQESAADSARVNHLHACATHLHQLLGQVLDFSSIESGRLETRPVSFDPGQVIQEVVDMHQVLAEGKNLKVKLVIRRIDRFWIGDPVLLRQILINLLSNAIKYTPAGEVRVRLDYEKQNESLQAKFIVEDSGPGIPEDKQDYIFLDFTRLSRAGESEVAGTGLGLAIAKQMTERMRGSLRLDGDYRQGARFVLELPFDLGGPIRAKKRMEGSDHSQLLRGKHVLVADDMDFNRYVCRELLEKFGARVCEAEDGRIALQALREDRFDLAILDINMPKLNGHQVVRKFLQKHVGRPPLFIALTAHVTAEMEQSALEAGFKHYMEKPLDPDEIVRIALAQPLRDKTANASDLLSYLAGDGEASRSKLRTRYLEAMREQVELLHTYIGKKDRETSKAVLHKLHGLANMGRRADVIHLIAALSNLISSEGDFDPTLEKLRQLRELLRED